LLVLVAGWWELELLVFLETAEWKESAPHHPLMIHFLAQLREVVHVGQPPFVLVTPTCAFSQDVLEVAGVQTRHPLHPLRCPAHSACSAQPLCFMNKKMEVSSEQA